MKTLSRWAFAIACLLNITAMPCIAAPTVQYQLTSAGGATYQYVYTLSNDLGRPIQEWTVFFNSSLYRNLFVVGSVPGWDLITVQPDTSLPADGFFDALTTASGLASADSASGFTVSFDYLGTGLPGSQRFEIVDPVTFQTIAAGTTTTSAPIAIPAPATWSLALIGTLALAMRRRSSPAALTSRRWFRRGWMSVMLCAAFVCSPFSPAQAAGSADSSVQVTSLQKIAEKRVSRTVYDYTFRVTLRNTSAVQIDGVIGQVIGVGTGVQIVNGVWGADTVAPQATIIAADTITLRVDRLVPFSPADVVWQIDAASLTQLGRIEPARVYTQPLSALNVANATAVSTISGNIIEAKIAQGTLRFATGGDIGKESTAQIVVATPSGAVSLFAIVKTLRPTMALLHVEPLDDGSDSNQAPAMEVTGFEPGNTLGASALRFSVPGAPPLDFKTSNGSARGSSGATVSLKPYWTYDATDGSFKLSTSQVASLTAALPPGDVNLTLNFVNKDGTFAQTYELTAIKPQTTLSGLLTLAGGNPATLLAGRKVLLVGFNSGIRRVATIDGSARFSFNGLIPDTFQVSLLDLDAPGVTVGVAPVFVGSSTAAITLIYAPPLTSNAVSIVAQGTPLTTNSFVSATTVQSGPLPTPRAAAMLAQTVAPNSIAANCATPGTASTVTFVATAAAQGDTVTCNVSYPVPANTPKVNVKATVYSAEYPVYTGSQSVYNDTWSYAVNGPTGPVLADSGSVNNTHYTQGTIYKTTCVDVSAQTASSGITFTGAATATNIGDSALPTITTLTLSTACAPLQVTDAKFYSPSGSNPILDPIRTTGNLSGPYLSLSPTSAGALYGIPTKIHYTPSDVTITDVNLGFAVSGGTPTFTATNVVSQGTVTTPGEISFSKLNLPPLPNSRTTGKLSLYVQLKGTDTSGNAVSSNYQDGGQIEFEGRTTFIPLYLANAEPGLGTNLRRYGTRDAGGDSWATNGTISFLSSNAFRFDDISAYHVAQTSAGRSVLGHSGHSDGQQIDLRYADGSGGYSDALGGQSNGASIKAMLDAAAAEVAQNSSQKPQLAQAVAWVNANRALLTSQAMQGPTRKIFIGPTFIMQALVNGMFPDGTTMIPGLAVCRLPANVFIDAAHLSHWHLSTTAHP